MRLIAYCSLLNCCWLKYMFLIMVTLVRVIICIVMIAESFIALHFSIVWFILWLRSGIVLIFLFSGPASQMTGFRCLQESELILFPVMIIYHYVITYSVLNIVHKIHGCCWEIVFILLCALICCITREKWLAFLRK